MNQTISEALSIDSSLMSAGKFSENIFSEADWISWDIEWKSDRERDREKDWDKYQKMLDSH